MSAQGEGRAPCGTYAAWQQHRKRGEPTDLACREALRQYQTAYRKDNPQRLKVDAAVRSRALTRLAQLHPDEFADLRAQVRLELTGGA